MTIEEINKFEKLESQISGIYTEITTLSKKSQNDALNKFKLKFVNQLISEANELLGDIHKPFNDFNLFDEDDLPTNSDAAMMLSQYISCLEKMRADNVMKKSIYWYWIENGEISDLRTVAPKKFKEK